jgi:hypothetical protein
MSAPGPPRTPVFRTADPLRARDLDDWRDAPIEALATHALTLHRLSGVAGGLVVDARRADDGRWARWLFTASPGAAVDALGRTLVADASTPAPPAVVTPTVDARLPASAARAALKLLVVISGDPPGRRGPGRGRISPQSARIELVGVGEEGELVYQTRCRPLHVWEVPLAGVRFYRLPDTNAVAVTLSGGERSVALRSFRAGFLATGVVPPGTTAQRLEGERDGVSVTAGWQVWVDTRAAGFLSQGDTPEARGRLAPVYLAGVGRTGSRSDQALLLAGRTALADTPEAVLDGLARDGQAFRPRVSVSEARHDGFLLSVEYPTDHPGLDLGELDASPIEVRWAGFERPLDPAGARPQTALVGTKGVVVSRPTDRQPLPWPSFVDGQRLAADDLNNLQNTLRQLLWLHNRTLHGWGVSEGLSVARTESGRAVRVAPGYALDLAGHELILNDLVQLDVPPRAVPAGPESAKDWYVVLFSREGDGPADPDRTTRLDGPRLRHISRAEVTWKDPQDQVAETRLRPGLDVILATVTVKSGEVTGVTAVGRREAVPPSRPYVAAGRSDPPGVRAYWWPDDAPEHPDGIRLHIDTQLAGFGSNPTYQVQLEKPEAPPAPAPGGVGGGVPAPTPPEGTRTLKDFTPRQVILWASDRTSLDVVLAGDLPEGAGPTGPSPWYERWATWLTLLAFLGLLLAASGELDVRKLGFPLPSSPQGSGSVAGPVLMWLSDGLTRLERWVGSVHPWERAAGFIHGLAGQDLSAVANNLHLFVGGLLALLGGGSVTIPRLVRPNRPKEAAAGPRPRARPATWLERLRTASPYLLLALGLGVAASGEVDSRKLGFAVPQLRSVTGDLPSRSAVAGVVRRVNAAVAAVGGELSDQKYWERLTGWLPCPLRPNAHLLAGALPAMVGTLWIVRRRAARRAEASMPPLARLKRDTSSGEPGEIPAALLKTLPWRVAWLGIED